MRTPSVHRRVATAATGALLSVWAATRGLRPRHRSRLVDWRAWGRRRRRSADSEGGALGTEGGGEAQERLYRLAAIIESAQQAILDMDLHGTIRSWNPGAERMCGYTAAEAVGRPITIVVPMDRRDEATTLYDQARTGTPVHRDTVWARKNGERIDVALTISPVHDVAGTVTGMSTIACDITEERRTAAVLDGTLGALELALNEAQESEARSRRFLADAAHQLRTPIAGIRACAETLTLGASPCEQERLLADLVRETLRAARLISSLLRVARLDQGELLSPQPCDVVLLCSEEAERARSLAPHLDISLHVDDLAEPKPELDTDAAREILANLLNNASRHARSAIDVTVQSDEAVVELRVANDGPALDPDTRERVFERFVSLDGKGGSGLGLSIARGLARSHRGEITYEDDSFVVRLPSRPGAGVAEPDWSHQEFERSWRRASRNRSAKAPYARRT